MGASLLALAKSIYYNGCRVLDLVDTQTFFHQPSSSPFLPLPCSMVCIFQVVDCPPLRPQYMFNESFSLYLYWIFRV